MGESEGNAIAQFGTQAAEAQKGLRKIISIWQTLAGDHDPVIRLVTVMATVLAFVALVLLIIFAANLTLVMIRPEFHDPGLIRGIVFGMIIIVVLFIGSVTPIALKLSSRANAEILKNSFQNVIEHRYGTVEGRD